MPIFACTVKSVTLKAMGFLKEVKPEARSIILAVYSEPHPIPPLNLSDHIRAQSHFAFLQCLSRKFMDVVVEFLVTVAWSLYQ